jgi:hypothetical protein
MKLLAKEVKKFKKKLKESKNGQKGRVHRSMMTHIVARWEMLAGQDNAGYIFEENMFIVPQ